MKKILIMNAVPSNRGNYALIITTKEIIKNFVYDAKICLSGPDKIKTSQLIIERHISHRLYLEKPHTILIGFLYLVKCIYIRLISNFMNVSISKNSRLYYCYNSDIVVNSGGDHLSGEYGLNPLGTFLNISYALALKKPVVLFGESLGYYKNPIIKKIANYILNKTRLILVRENLSKEYLLKNNIKNPDIYVTADPAFYLSPVRESKVIHILNKENIKLEKNPVIGINPSGLINKFENKLDLEKDLNLILAKVSDFLIKELNASILLIPHVYTSTDDDRSSISLIYEKVENKENVSMIKGEYSPQELKGVIGLCDLFIGARMHAMIAATSMMVPTVGIAYSHKTHGIIGDMLGQEKYILDINQINFEDLIYLIIDAWNNRDTIKSDLEHKIPLVKERALMNGKLVKDLMDSLKIS